VLAERLGTSRNAVYKTLFDARVTLRAHLGAAGYLPTAGPGSGAR
jgi:RNA polymerase sigma-70 factor (ECF subfamily)